jgi:Cu/Zn superoxide dismutase
METKMKCWMMGLLLVVFLAGCNDDDDATIQNSKTYTLAQLDSSGVSGTVTFTKQNNETTKIVVQLTGTQAGSSHPAHIHSGKASEGGPIVLDFNPVDGATGKSETMVTKFNDGTAVTYEELINYNGHVNVHKSATELAIMIAQGNIGSNATASTNTSGQTGGNGGY